MYPIQANFISVRELFIQPHVPADRRLEIPSGDLIFKTAHSAYDDTRQIIEVGVQLEYGIETKPDQLVPYSLRVHLMGQFRVDEQQFDIAKIDTWARINAPYILYPYLREHVFALTARCGFDPVLLPLVELPTFKVQREVGESEAAVAAGGQMAPA